MEEEWETVMVKKAGNGATARGQMERKPWGEAEVTRVTGAGSGCSR